MSWRLESGLILGFGGSDESRIGPAVQTLSKIVRELACGVKSESRITM
jgi:hypothetical protein